MAGLPRCCFDYQSQHIYKCAPEGTSVCRDRKTGLGLVATNPQAHERLVRLLGLKWPLERELTMGGRMFWTDIEFNRSWRLQKNDVFGNCRILDSEDLNKGWGGETEISTALAQVSIEFALL